MFDFDSQTGIMHVLASIRASEISSAEKGELRDLVFLYANGGHDAGVRRTLEQKLQAHQVAAAPKNTSQKSAQDANATEPGTMRTIGSQRRAPQFSTPQPQKKVAPTPAPVRLATPVEVPAKAPLPPISQPQPQPQPQPQSSTSVAAQKAEEATSTAEPAQQPASTQVPTVSTAPAPASDATLARIREIKTSVNDKVGNPVNLVDIDNEVGREYMSALLDAMKKLNSGSAVAPAMERLETAFAAVTVVIEKHEATQTSASDSTKESSAATPVPTPAPVQSERTSAPVATTPPVATPSPVAPVTPQPHTANIPINRSPSRPPQTSSEPKLREQVISTPSADTNGRWGGVPKPDVATATPRADAADTAPSTTTEAAPPPPTAPVSASGATPEVTTAPATSSRVASLADSETKLKTPSALPDPASVETSSKAGDPLFTKEVDQGLEQLLVEWPIFKKSGLFGTGPKGLEHPLYKQIKDLQIPLLLSGRFEGATQEIKQSITDYMNGWRYEQGIIYKEGESFEQYLRRVIRHILDLHQL